MKVKSIDNRTLGIGNDLVFLFMMAMDTYYDTVQSVCKEKDVKGTVEPIISKRFKGKGIFIETKDNPTSELLTISKVEVGSFGITLFFVGGKEDIIISYDSLKLAIKKS